MSNRAGYDALRLLILNGDLPVFPGRAGHEYLHTTHLAHFAQQVGLVSMVHTREQADKQGDLAKAHVKLYLWESPHLSQASTGQQSAPRGARRVGKALYNCMRTWPRRPPDTAGQDLQFRNMAPLLLQALSEESWQATIVVQSSNAHWLDYLPRFPVSILVMHDVRALVYERWAQATSFGVRRLTRLVYAWLYRRFEQRYCHQYDLVITVSSADEAWVRRHYRPDRLVTIPIPVDSEYFKPLPDIDEAPARIVFSGMMDHPPNTDAAQFFVYSVLPQIRATIPEAEFWIVGRNPPPQITALSRLPGVVVTGFVPDIRPYLAQATVIVVPLRFGSGMRNKILEAWAMQKCVISTSIGAEGLDYSDGENILIADDASTMAERVVQVLQDPWLRNRLRSRGRAVAVTQHHPDKLAQQYYDAIASTFHNRKCQHAPMHVVIDLRWMYPGVAGGIENLSRSFVDNLLNFDSYNQYTILLPTEVKYDFDLRNHRNFRCIAADVPSYYFRKLFWNAIRLAHRHFEIDYWRSDEVEGLRFVHDLKPDIVLSLSGYISKEMYSLRNVLVVHDLQHEYHPGFFSAEALEERKRVFGESIRQADYLIAVSEYTRQTVIERFAIDPQRIRTVHEAADPMYHPANHRHVDHRSILRKYDLSAGEYVFFPANTWPHKNHQGALEAFAILREKYCLRPLFVCTGTPKEEHGLIIDTIHRLELDRQVRFLGYCPLEDMPSLYENAIALFFPSLFEGFGIPLLEAMWCSCPIICSNKTSLPEIAGDAALLVDPHSPECMAEAIKRLMTDEELRCVLVERGQQRVKKFSWSNFTMEVVRVLHQAREIPVT
jgi:glycosyltransferase involved in cell wall biosynthesis